ncbi:MAG: FAD-dependent oxidoreductase [Vicinamibacterales bacterium]
MRSISPSSATVVGAGVFGAWIAHALHSRGWRVTLIDQHGPANSRASSGGETRIIRSGYGSLAVYAQWARQSLADWIALEHRVGEQLFVRTGALFLGSNAAWLSDTAATLNAEDIPCERMEHEELSRRFPQLAVPDGSGAVFEPDAGVLFARRAVQRLVAALVEDGVTLMIGRVRGATDHSLRNAGAVIFACGPWLPSLFPQILGEMIAPTQQPVYFFGAPAGDTRFSAAELPAWVAFDDGIYGLPDLEHRGIKIAIDAHGPPADPERMDRAVDAEGIAAIRRILRRRLPGLADAPLLEARVCQYENTPDGHFLFDRLPGHDRVWIAGGGSGHGFKHGPAVGRHVADLVEGAATDPRFQLAGRPPRGRAVY